MADSYSINNRHHLPKFIDMLKEVANIGAGNAATALSSLLDKK